MDAPGWLRGRSRPVSSDHGLSSLMACLPSWPVFPHDRSSIMATILAVPCSTRAARPSTGVTSICEAYRHHGRLGPGHPGCLLGRTGE